MPQAIRVTAEIGGTWVRVRAQGPNGRKVFSVKESSFPTKELPSFLKKLFQSKKTGTPESLLVGARGHWKASKQKALKQRLKGLAENIEVISDVELAHRESFGGGAGIILIAGTGSIAYGRNAKGKTARAGGLGPEKGDEGSAYWIGREVLKRTGKDFKSRSVRDLALLAKNVVRKAQEKDAVASAVISEAWGHLSKILFELKEKLGGKELPLKLYGGLFENAYFKKGFKAQGGRCRVRTSG